MTARIDSLKHLIAEHHIDTIECGLGDLHGQLRGKRFTVEHFLAIAEQGFGMGDGVFSFDHASVLAETTFTPGSGGYPDMRVRPLLDTFRPIPWQPGAAAVLCEALTEGERMPLPICPRQALRRILQEAAKEGYQFLIATELEFYLLSPDRPTMPTANCYSLTSGAVLEPALREIRQGLTDFGIAVEGSHLEYGAGQVEVNTRPVPALTAADNTLYFKSAVKEIAARHGLQATFMAKPWADQPGSGMHIHMSLSEGRTGPLMDHFLAGLLTHLPGLIFLSSPTVNSYKRLVEHSFAPTNATWGIDNRTTAVRMLGHGQERWLEYRAAGADANPYLLLAGCVSAALDGLRQARNPPPRMDGNASVLTHTLPRSLAEGITAFAEDRGLQEAMGLTLMTHLLEMARREWHLFLKAVTEWERDRYRDFA